MNTVSVESLSLVRATRRVRLLAVLAIVPFFLGVLTYSQMELLFNIFELPFAYYFGVALACIAVSIFSACMLYLQTGFRMSRHSIPVDPHDTYQEELNQIRTEFASLKDVPDRLSSIEARLAEVLQSRLEISETERAELVQRTRESIENAASIELIEEIRSAVSQDQQRRVLIKTITRQYERTIGRLKDSLDNLRWRGNLNLAIGSTTAIVGIGLLFVFVMEGGLGTIDDLPKLLGSFLPRVTIVIIVEALAYFFLITLESKRYLV